MLPVEQTCQVGQVAIIPGEVETEKEVEPAEHFAFHTTGKPLTGGHMALCSELTTPRPDIVSERWKYSIYGVTDKGWSDRNDSVAQYGRRHKR